MLKYFHLWPVEASFETYLVVFDSFFASWYKIFHVKNPLNHTNVIAHLSPNIHNSGISQTISTKTTI